MTNKEILALCDGTTGEEMSVAIPVKDALRLGVDLEANAFDNTGVWLQVCMIRSLVHRSED